MKPPSTASRGVRGDEKILVASAGLSNASLSAL
jgi:hypothetical protein